MGWVNLCVCVTLAFFALSAADSDEAADLTPSSEESQRAPFSPMGFLPSFLGSGAGSGRPDMSALIGNFMPGMGAGGGSLADFLAMFGNAMNSGSRSKRSAEGGESAADSDETADLSPSSEESQRGFLSSFFGSGSGGGGLADFLSMFGNAMNFGSRSKRSAEGGESANAEGQEPSGDGHEGHQHRLFFNTMFNSGSSGVAVPCNFTTQAGSTCLSCTQALTCRSNNAGILRTCRGSRPFCNGGVCSRAAGPQCFNGTATTG